MSIQQPPIRARLRILNVQTRLQVLAEAGKDIRPMEAATMAAELEAAADILMRTITAAAHILENGSE